MAMFYPAEDEKPPFFAVEEGQAPLDLPDGMSNEAEEDEEAPAEEAPEDSGAADDAADSSNGDAAEAAPEAAPAESDSPAPADG